MDGPQVRVLSGSPDDAELAALVAVLSALAAGTVEAAGPVTPLPRACRPVVYPLSTSWRTRR